MRAGYSEQSESKQDVAALRQQIHKILLADSLVADELTKLPNASVEVFVYAAPPPVVRDLAQYN